MGERGMNREQARKLIVDVFESSFNKDRYKNFLRNLLKSYDERRTFDYKNNFRFEAFRESIQSLERIGKYVYDDKEIDLLIVTLKKETSLERARTLQRNFIAWYLNGSRGGKLKDAGLVAFVSPSSEDWRFSLVKMDYKFDTTSSGKIKVKEEFTPARRWSFLVGKNEKSHTAQTRFIPILENDESKPTLEVLKNAFNIETVTEEFFKKYRDLFIKLKKELDRIVEKDECIKKEFQGKNINTVDFTKKLLGQIVFLYFMQKKGWFGVPKGQNWGTGSKDFLRRLFNKEYGDYRNFFNDILEPLFYEALRTDRNSCDHYYSRFNCKIPFLNGGLFDPINDYDWVNTEIEIPDSLFSNENRTQEGDIGDGILDIFDRYNFTVNEEEPLEKEVALDPELLGKIYEKLNAIREDNFDEYLSKLKSGNARNESEFNREYGVYYTPREIVHYMCKESLIEYLHTNVSELDISREDIESFVRYSNLILEHEKTALEKKKAIQDGIIKETKYTHKMPECIIKNAKRLDDLLENIKVCDPAVGSGAFLVGMMHEIVNLRELLNVYINGTDEDVRAPGNISRYELKRHCIENSLYGVDIDAGAIETCKLRFWLSLVVDEEDFRNIKPLPNLDYKVVCGDSLLCIEENLLNFNNLNTLEELKNQYFNETNPLKKLKYKERIDSLIREITQNHNQFDFKVYFSEVFHQGTGFDIVIANPPYIQLQREGGKLATRYKKQSYQTFARTGDIYCLFYEKGLELLKNDGVLCYITSNKWMRAGYGEKLRSFFTQYNPLLLIDLGPGVFENATVDTNILLIQKKQTLQKHLKALTLQKQNDTVNIEQQVQERAVILEKLTKDAWFIGSSAEQQLKEKIERIGKPLKDWDVNIYYGIKTGLNEAFIITTEKRNEILANCKDEAERKRTEAIIKPILRGRDIKRYYYEWAGLWVIFIPWHFPLHEDTSIQGASEKAEKEFQKQYPAVYNHLLEFKKPLLKRNKEETGIRYEWYALQRCAATYYPEFEKEKVVWGGVVTTKEFFKLRLGILEGGKYLNAPANFMITSNTKYFIGYLNSYLNNWFYNNFIGTVLHKDGIRFYVDDMLKIPLPPITSENQPIVSQIESLVDKILSAKKANPQADTKNFEDEIDHLVYKLYDLTPEEIKIIEGGK